MTTTNKSYKDITMFYKLKKRPVFSKTDFCESAFFGTVTAAMAATLAITISQVALNIGINNAMDDIELVDSFNDKRIIEEITQCTEKSAAEIVAATQLIHRQNDVGYNVDVTTPIIMVNGDEITATASFEQCAENTIHKANFEMAKAEASENMPLPLKDLPLIIILGTIGFLGGFGFMAKMQIADNKWHNKWVDDWEERERKWKEADDRWAKQIQNNPAPDHT